MLIKLTCAVQKAPESSFYWNGTTCFREVRINDDHMMRIGRPKLILLSWPAWLSSERCANDIKKRVPCAHLGARNLFICFRLAI